MANGDIIKLGTFYMDGVKQARPTYPWANGYTPTGAPGAGNIPRYASGNIEIRDTDIDDAYKINWIEVNDGDKQLLISDRNILVNVSWDILNAQGLIFGKDVTIDGQQYKLRVLTGGTNYRSGADNYSGGTPTTNEWDRIITNESSFSGLPIPNITDLDTTQNETDRLGTHNKVWNWYYSCTLCQEARAGDTSTRSVRGMSSARSCYFNKSSVVYTNAGWRPVLEVLSSAPLISGSDGNLGVFTDPLVKDYSVSDYNRDKMTITEKLDDKVIRRLENQSSGDLQMDLTEHWGLLKAGMHSIEIQVSDGKLTSTRTWKFGKDYGTGLIHKLGTLYLNGVKHNPPEYPWGLGGTPGGAPCPGDMPRFPSDTLEIRDTEDDESAISWVEVNDGDKKLLIADRGLVCATSWQGLNSQGFVEGKEITIDGKKYKIRLLTGGSSKRDTNGGNPVDNEWDRIIVNEGGFGELPSPVSSDLDSTLNSNDATSEHNKFWNWFGACTWVKETSDENPNDRVLRGYHSAQEFGTDGYYNWSVDFCWRPVLEPAKETFNLQFKTIKQEVDYQPKLISVVDKSTFDKEQREDLTISIKACNNANDETPTWEDMTESYLNETAYSFKNTTKTSENWAVSVHYDITTIEYRPSASVSAVGIGVL